MPLPSLTHLQYLVVSILVDGETSGPEIRKLMSAEKVNILRPAFYRLMSHLEKEGLAEGWYVQKTVKNQVIRERRYRITGHGKKCQREACMFYNMARSAKPLLGQLGFVGFGGACND